MITTTNIQLGYRPELDGLRGISILLVFVHHIYAPLLPGGFLGVDIFFVLSGFLITSLLLQEWHRSGSISIKNFYIRRALRLLPAITLLSVALAVFALFLNDQLAGKTYHGIWLALSYVSNWLYAFRLDSADNPLGVTWSLAIEEQFYLFWPLVLRFALRSTKLTRRGLVLITVALIGLVILHRAWLMNQAAPVERLYYASDTRADAILIGCLVAFLFSWNLLPQATAFKIVVKAFSVLAVAFLVYMAITATWDDLLMYHSLVLTLISLSAGVLVVGILILPSRFIKAVLQFVPLVWIGRISYGLYLWHWPVKWFVYRQGNGPGSKSQMMIAILISVLLPTLSYYLVEKRFLRWKGRFTALAAKPSLSVET